MFPCALLNSIIWSPSKVCMYVCGVNWHVTLPLWKTVVSECKFCFLVFSVFPVFPVNKIFLFSLLFLYVFFCVNWHFIIREVLVCISISLIYMCVLFVVKHINIFSGLYKYMSMSVYQLYVLAPQNSYSLQKEISVNFDYSCTLVCLLSNS